MIYALRHTEYELYIVVSEIYELKICKKKVIVYDALGNNIAESPSLFKKEHFMFLHIRRFVCLNIRL